MIRPLRVVHRRVWLVTAVVLPVLLVSALAVRRTVPTVATIPGVTLEGQLLLAVEGRRADGQPLGVSVHRTAGGRLAVEIPGMALRGMPELLAYWVPTDGVDPIANGTLLGAVRGDALLPLPARAESTSGMLALYDLARGEVAATARLPRPAGAP